MTRSAGRPSETAPRHRAGSGGKSGCGAILDGEKAAERRLAGNRAREGNPRAGRADARVPRSMPSSAVPVLAFLGTEGTGSFIASRLCGRQGRGAVRRCSRKSIRGNRARHPAVDCEGVAPERHGDAGVRAARRRRMRTAEAFAVGKPRREASAPGTRGVGRARTTRLASVAIVTARVPQEKTTQPSDKLFASLNGATDERAPWRSRPSRLGRSRAARGGEMPRAVYALGDASRAAPNPEAARTPIDSLCKQTRWITLLRREMNECYVRARRPAKPRAARLDRANHASKPVVPPRRVPTTRSLKSPGRASLRRARVPRD